MTDSHDTIDKGNQFRATAANAVIDIVEQIRDRALELNRTREPLPSRDAMASEYNQIIDLLERWRDEE